MRLVCTLHFKCNIPGVHLLALLLVTWQRLGICSIPKTSENLELCSCLCNSCTYVILLAESGDAVHHRITSC